MVRGVGGQVGPDLSMIGKKSARENLYESILIPSKAIADQYIQHQVTTTAEVTISGLARRRHARGDHAPRRQRQGHHHPRRRTSTGEVRKLKVSIMPEDIVAALTEDELVDLVAYLETLKTAALTPDSFHIAGPFKAANMDAALDAESGPEKKRVRPGREVRRAITWKTIRPDGKGYFDLAALHGTAGNNSASYMYVEIESPADQDAEVLLGADDGSRLWVNGKEVFASRETRAAAPEQHKVRGEAQEGRRTRCC